MHFSAALATTLRSKDDQIGLRLSSQACFVRMGGNSTLEEFALLIDAPTIHASHPVPALVAKRANLSRLVGTPSPTTGWSATVSAALGS